MVSWASSRQRIKQLTPQKMNMEAYDEDDDDDDDDDDESFQESPLLGIRFQVKDMIFLPVLVPPDVVETVRSQYMPSNSHSLCMS